jgi:CheY-like chemotaxis protein
MADKNRTSCSLEAVELELRETLANLADPFHQPPELLRQIMGLDPRSAAGQLHKQIHSAIQSLRPSEDVPRSTRAWRIYELLNARYLEEQTQKETALRLGMTVRHLRREQQLAVRLLAQHLWESAPANVAGQAPTLEPLVGEDDDAWRQQVRAEWSRLQETAAGIPAGLREAAGATVELLNTMSPKVNVHLELADDYIVGCHPTILRQLFLIALEKLLQRLHTTGEIHIGANGADGVVQITISGAPIADTQLPDSDFIREILDMQNSNLRVEQRGERLVMEFSLPMVQRQPVLLVDDNPDLVHLYSRYVEGTRYEIVHTDRGQGALALAEQIQPVSIVLDIMLPDMDGWDLLQSLKNHPLTKAIPVVICSVVRREELALALGARALLSKPVRRQEFLATLDQMATP